MTLHKKHTGASANYAQTQGLMMAGIATDQFTKGILDNTQDFGGWTNEVTRSSSTPPRLTKETTSHKAYAKEQREYHANDFKQTPWRRFSKQGSYLYMESRVHKCDPGPAEFQPIGGFNTLKTTGGRFNKSHSKTCTEQAVSDKVGCLRFMGTVDGLLILRMFLRRTFLHQMTHSLCLVGLKDR
jgi:hypothetical protein